MPEENYEQNLNQNQSNQNLGSDMVRQDGGILDGNRNNDEGSGTQNNKKRFDLLGSTYEDSIWNSSLDGDKNDNNIPKTYPGKKWRNARAIVLIVNIIFSMLGRLTLGLELLFTTLMVIFMVLRIKTVRSPENQEIIQRRNIGKRLKGIIWLYAIFTVMYVIYDINLVVNVELEYTIDDIRSYIEGYLSSFDLAFYNDRKNTIDEEIINVANEYAGCNCFGDNATQNTKDSFTSAEFENIIRKVGFDITMDVFLYALEQDTQYGKIIENHEEEVRLELIKSANNVLGIDCFGIYENACDLSTVDIEDLWTKTYTDATSNVAPKVDNGIWK